MELKQIYNVSDLVLSHGKNKILDINTLKFHNGLIYGLCGNFGSGKSSLMQVLSGHQAQSKGDVFYQGAPVAQRLHLQCKTSRPRSRFHPKVRTCSLFV